MRKKLLTLLTLIVTLWSHGQDSASVLFIGNSYTYANDLPNMTRLLSESLGKQLTVSSKTNGGYTFQNHCNDPQTFNAMHQENWDVVVLQAQSQEPSFSDDQVNAETVPYAIQLADSVYAINPCSNVLYYMTWGRENGDPQWGPISTFEGMNERLYNAYMRMADSTDGMVAAVGAAWKYVRDHYPTIDLYVGDGSHPTEAGTYLVACTFYTSIFQQPVTGAPYIAGLDAQTAGQLQGAADLVVLDSLEHFRLHPIDEPVQASFTFQQNGEEVQFTNTSTRDESIQWWFGDGNGSQENDPFHVYSTNNLYEITLIASNGCTSDTAITVINVTSVGVNELSLVDYKLLEYNDYFEVLATTKPIYYEMYTLAGEKTLSGKILTGDFQRIRKIETTGVIVLKNERGNSLSRAFCRW